MAATTAILLVALLAAPCALAETSVLKHLQASHFTGFLRLLEHADAIPDVEAALKAGKTLTVFAPTDDALMYHTSPTLMAFLKLKENKETLRQVLLSHFVAERLSPFQWEGAHKTLAGTELPLTMDAQAFYAANVAVMQYNALVGSDGALHSVPSLIIPASLSSSAQIFLEDGTDSRRVLMKMMKKHAHAPGPAPAAAMTEPQAGGKGKESNGAIAQAAVSAVATVAAAAAAVFLF